LVMRIDKPLTINAYEYFDHTRFEFDLIFGQGGVTSQTQCQKAV